MRSVAVGVAGLIAATVVVTGCNDAPSVLPGRKVVPNSAPTVAISATKTPDRLVLRDRRIGESSGLASSRSHPGVLYTHNDRGHAAEVFAVDADGHTRAVLELAGAAPADLEDIAVTPRSGIWVADIGDNEQRRSVVSVYVAPEPDELADASLSWTRYRFHYEDGPRNAEALMVHPETERVYVISKEGQRGGVYAAPASPRADEVNVLRKVADVPAGITAAAFSPDGTRIAMRSYANAFVYTELGSSPWVLRLPATRQGESLTFTPDGAAILVGSEGVGSTVDRVWLPQSLATPPSDEGAS